MADQQLFFINLIPSGINGESLKQTHLKWMEAQSWSFHMHQTADHSLGASAGTGTAAVGSFSFERVFDEASPRLFDRVSRGTHMPSMTFEAERQGQQQANDGVGSIPTFVYFQLIFTDVVVTNRSTSWTDGSRGTEGLSFAFGQVSLTYKMLTTQGTVQNIATKTYNVKQNQAS
jgi:type VI secretion system secreted protein Hcp